MNGPKRTVPLCWGENRGPQLPQSDPAPTVPKELMAQKRRTCPNTSIYSAGSEQTKDSGMLQQIIR